MDVTKDLRKRWAVPVSSHFLPHSVVLVLGSGSIVKSWGWRCTWLKCSMNHGSEATKQPFPWFNRANESIQRRSCFICMHVYVQLIDTVMQTTNHRETWVNLRDVWMPCTCTYILMDALACKRTPSSHIAMAWHVYALSDACRWVLLLRLTWAK